ncbi:hypothetical protein [Clostridium mediterraneense]|uniref:hypothetical protein n=1 Tax=Clostridium mediterraneense TaxID=1805472 RepID=UPI0008355A32|nr:hypothetical protein [Clostridium mediterraneense]
MEFKKLIKDNKFKPVLGIILAVIVFSGVYLGSYYYNLGKIAKVNANVEQTNAENTNVLKDDIVIMFMKKNQQNIEEIYYQVTVSELKERLKLDKVSEKELETMLKEKGYSKVKSEDNKIIFTKEEGTGLTPNKYYLGDKDGNIAIFKTDENGKAFIEKPSDVSVKKLYSLPKMDSDIIKSFGRQFDTREECEEELSAYVS